MLVLSLDSCASIQLTPVFVCFDILIARSYTSMTPWGKPTKGMRTRDVHNHNKLIIKRRFEE
jgi:hypothetical protein